MIHKEMKRHVGYETVGENNIFYIHTGADTESRKMVIMLHGFRGSSVGPSRAFVDFERLLIDAGYDVLRFDQPCCGNSSGDFIDSSFNSWVSTTIYFIKKYLSAGYEIALLGQSMGATTAMVASVKEGIIERIRTIMLWVPDPKSTFNNDPDVEYEEGGQRYKGTFWLEARNAGFFDCLETYTGSLHLVYGESDKYIDAEMRNMVIKIAEQKGHLVSVLAGQDHSSWDYSVMQDLYQQEIGFLRESFKSVSV